MIFSKEMIKSKEKPARRRSSPRHLLRMDGRTFLMAGFEGAHSRCISFMMNVGTEGGLSRSSNLVLVSAFDSWRNFLKRAVVLTTKEKALFRRMTMAVIWARVAALFALRTLGLRRIGVSSLAALLIRSEAERCCFSF